MRPNSLLCTCLSVLVLTVRSHIVISNNDLCLVEEDDDDDDKDKATCHFLDDGDTCLLLFDDANDVFGTITTGGDTIDVANRSLALEFFDVFRRLGVSWGHIIRSYRRIIDAASGREVDGDVRVDTMEEALVQLKSMNSDSEMILSYDTFDKDTDDLLVAFLNWAATNPAEPRKAKCRGGINGRSEKINVSMAFRRLQVYHSWMKEAENDLSDSSLSAMSVQEVGEAFSMQVSHDECGRLVWWMDLAKADIERVKSLPPAEIRRFYIWLAHIMIFDEGAQTNGVVFVNSLSDIGFWQFMTILPLELGIKTDEFMICVVPLNTKLVLFLERPTWANFAYGILKIFLKAKMRRRVVMAQRQKQQDTVEHAVGKSFIPNGFNGLDGNPQLGSLLDGYFETTV